MNVLVTYAILAAALLYLNHRNRRHFEREAARDAERQARRDYDALDALIQATREWPHESYAWGPEGQAAGCLPVEVSDFGEREAEWARYRLEQEESDR